MEFNSRILIVDDNRSIHEDFRKVLCAEIAEEQKELDGLEDELFGDDNDDETTKPTGVKAEVEYNVNSAYQGQEALKMIIKAEDEGHPYTMCFMDVRMPPGWDGIETIQRIWEKFPYVEMVLCTAYSDYSWDEILGSLGNTDRLLFLRKPFDSIAVLQMASTLVKKWNLGVQAKSYVKELEKEVTARTAQLNNILVELESKNKELETSNKALEYAALHDVLTKLPNRALFGDRLEHNIQVACRDNDVFALASMDIDKFKDINDTHGHLIGDIVLKEIGERMLLALRNSDTVARLGGDEFAILLPSVDQEALPPIIDKVTKIMEAPIVCDDLSLSVGSSLGITFYPQHGLDAESLMHNADIAMYQAKQAGLAYIVYDPSEDNNASDSNRLVADLREAIIHNGLTLNYQPIISLDTKTVYGVEALSRWIHPTHGFISPEEFISIAEQKGLIQDLTLWVLDEAFKQCSVWHQAGAPITMSVNLSVRNFLDPHLPDKIADALDRWNVKSDWIKLEITESMTMSNPEKALKIVHTFKEMGLHLSIDDFGSGYSSLAYLKRLPVDELKIDRGFIMEMDDSPDDRIIVKSTIDLAHNLGLKVVAEGVENENTLAILSELGCDKAQGFHICRPKAPEEISAWIFESNWAIEKAS